MNDLLLALWRSSWQGALVIALVWCFCRAFERRTSPALRCTLWRLAYAKLLLGLLIVGGFALPLLRPVSPPRGAGCADDESDRLFRAYLAPCSGGQGIAAATI